MSKIDPVTGKFIRFRTLPTGIETRLNERMPWPDEYFEVEAKHFGSAMAFFSEPDWDSVRPRRVGTEHNRYGVTPRNFVHLPA